MNTRFVIWYQKLACFWHPKSKKTCLKSVSPDGKIVARSCSPTHEETERCDSPNGGKMCYCNTNLCNSSANFKVNYVAIFGVLAMFHLLK